MNPADIKLAREKWRETQRRTQAREKEEQDWKRTPEQIAAKVKAIRIELEAAKRRFDGAIFDMIRNEMPRSMDREEKRDANEIVSDSQSFENGADLRTIQTLLGHARL